MLFERPPILSKAYIDGTLFAGGIHERFDELIESFLYHLVFAFSDPVLVVSHDQEGLSVVGGAHVTSSVQHADSQLFCVGVTDFTIVSDLFGDEILESVGWKEIVIRNL